VVTTAKPAVDPELEHDPASLRINGRRGMGQYMFHDRQLTGVPAIVRGFGDRLPTAHKK